MTIHFFRFFPVRKKELSSGCEGRSRPLGIRSHSFPKIGCIYPAQGFDFDDASVVVGKDMVYDIPVINGSVILKIHGIEPSVLSINSDI